MDPRLVETACAGSSSLLFGLYLLELHRDTKAAHPRTAAGIIAPLRAAWLTGVIREGRDIVCVQAVRNWIMFASMMASAALLAGVGVIGYALKEQPPVELFGHWGDNWGLSGVKTEAFMRLKILFLAGGLLGTFLNFTSCIRYYNHMVVCTTMDEEVEHRTRVALAFLRRGVAHQLGATRCLYACAAIALWVVGPLWLLGATVTIVVWLRYLDRLPAELRRQLPSLVDS